MASDHKVEGSSPSGGTNTMSKKILFLIILSISFCGLMLVTFQSKAEDPNPTPTNYTCSEAGTKSSTGGYITCEYGVRDELCCPKEGIVPCGTPCCRCGFCDFFILIDHIVDFIMFKIAPVLGVLMIIIGGVMFLVSSGDPARIGRAKKIVIYSIVGLLIIYTAYIMVGLILKNIGLADWSTELYKSWWSSGVYEIDCGSQGAQPVVM